MLKKMQIVCTSVLMMAMSIVHGDYNDSRMQNDPTRPDSAWCDHVRDSSVRGYIGILGGVDPLSGTFTATQTVSTETFKSTLGGTNGLVGGVLGMQVAYCEYGFFALQGNALYNTTNRNVLSATDTAGNVHLSTNIKNNFQWGIDGRFGVRVRTANPYILGGFESGSWKMLLTNDTPFSYTGVPANSSVKHSRTLWGGKVGAGITFPIVDCLWANMEYSYTWFGHLNKTLTDSLTGASWNHKSSIQQNSVLWGINYLF